MAEFAWNSRKAFRLIFQSDASFRLHRAFKKNIHFKEKTISSKLIDLSTGGCSLESPYPIPTGVKLNVFLDRNFLKTPSEKSRKREISRIVVVVRAARQLSIRKYRLGVQFEKLSSEDLRLIREFIERNDRREGKRIAFPT